MLYFPAMKHSLRLFGLLLVLLTSTACRGMAKPHAGPSASPAATSTPTLAAATAAPNSAPATAAPAAASLFDTAWDDRSLFRSGLIPAEQATLDALPGASVYHLDLRIADDLRSVAGHEDVHYTNTEGVALDEVYFRLFPELLGGSVRIDRVQVDGRAADGRYAKVGSTLHVRFPDGLAPNQSTVISIDFSVTVPTNAADSNYGIFGYVDNVLSLAHVYPMIEVYDAQGWNDDFPSLEGDVVYADASFYLVQITAPAAVTVVSSGTVLREQKTGDVQQIWVASGPARDFYLAASEDYQMVSAQQGDTVVRSWAPARLKASAQEVATIAAQALASLDKRLGPYPYTELDLVSTGTTALGVEYPGMIAINQRIYRSGLNDYMEMTVAHEVGHQWFYNVVGNDQLEEPWLDESLTQYVTWLYYGDRYGEKGTEGFRQKLLESWNAMSDPSIPIGLPVAEYSYNGAYPDSYGDIVYNRGPQFFEALRNQMGEEKFNAFLRDYYQSQRWGIATTASLRKLAETHCGCDLQALFDAWVYDH